MPWKAISTTLSSLFILYLERAKDEMIDDTPKHKNPRRRRPAETYAKLKKSSSFDRISENNNALPYIFILLTNLSRSSKFFFRSKVAPNAAPTPVANRYDITCSNPCNPPNQTHFGYDGKPSTLISSHNSGFSSSQLLYSLHIFLILPRLDKSKFSFISHLTIDMTLFHLTLPKPGENGDNFGFFFLFINYDGSLSFFVRKMDLARFGCSVVSSNIHSIICSCFNRIFPYASKPSTSRVEIQQRDRDFYH